MDFSPAQPPHLGFASQLALALVACLPLETESLVDYELAAERENGSAHSDAVRS
jgi:hypothetical protein